MIGGGGALVLARGRGVALGEGVAAVLGGRCSFCCAQMKSEVAMFASSEPARMCLNCVRLAGEMRGLTPPTKPVVEGGLAQFETEDEARIFLAALGVANEAGADFNDRLQELSRLMGLDQPVRSAVASIVGPLAASPREKRVCSFCRRVDTHPPMVTGGAEGEHAICEACLQQALVLLS